MAPRTSSTGIGWNFDNTYLDLPGAFYSTITPNAVPSPEIKLFNANLARGLGLNESELQTQEGINVLAGNEMPEGAAVVAQAYAGHQFGSLNMLGDGRALLIGEQLTPEGKRYDLQLKGSGPTPYSRRGDGRAALGPMIREFIISEAMHGLGIPTSRSLAVLSTGEPIRRETFLEGGILTRVASSHLRFGTFQYGSFGRPKEELEQLVDYAWNRHFQGVEEGGNRSLSMFKELMQRHASLVAKWQAVGFIHGVMNTDNMTISGETIDYGPCAFMDMYDPATVFSSIDTQGRYAYGNQPQITGWNLARLIESLLPLLHEDQEQALEMAKGEMVRFAPLYEVYWLEEMRKKLGLFNEEESDMELIAELLAGMKAFGADFTNTFRALTLQENTEPWQSSGEFQAWKERWQARLGRQEQTEAQVVGLMRQSNPAIIPRNHQVERAIEAAVKDGDYSVVNALNDALADPFAYSEQQLAYVMPDDKENTYQTFCGT